MNKILENKWLRLLFDIVTTILAGFIVFPVLDFFYSLITGGTFVYSIHEHIQEPIIFGVIFGLVSWIFFDRRGGKK